MTQKKDTNPLQERASTCMVECNRKLVEDEKSALLTCLLNDADINSIADEILRIPTLKTSLWQKFLIGVEEDSKSLTEKRQSYLYHNQYHDLLSFDWDCVVNE